MPFETEGHFFIIGRFVFSISTTFHHIHHIPLLSLAFVSAGSVAERPYIA